MRGLLVAVAIAAPALLGANAARAADLGGAPAYSLKDEAPARHHHGHWTGFYLGAHAGYGWGTTDSTAITASAAYPTGYDFPTSQSDGFIGGGQIGYNYQIHQWLLGVEGEGTWGKLSDKTRADSPLIAGRFTDITTDIKSMATLAARVGVVNHNWLFYGKGGFAWAHTSANSSTFTGAGALVSTSSGSETRNGWMLGAGVEYAFARNWSAKLEYEFIDLGRDTVTRTNVNTPGFGGAVTDLTREADTEIQTVKLGLNYRF